MASIKISELRPAGSELFQDSESFLKDLGAQEMANTIGASRIIVRSKTNIVVGDTNIVSIVGGG
ncbi:hypothetical protein LC605_21845 [Nostoc sp. CHAB 5836]|uniref:hypothetical protein n=1 Tax=Nostoc sp. CHAB 5836 TaxID=2780404 RepID=UPI001E4E44CC|nr:hypothetical protein [Nostoc sp. CHAB 5836]MCC5617683.1 hypothetical protein [Nostoc sp. CHAB 5836]